jgi:hypothetical protein
MVSFKACRSEPQLVSLARPTPRETKALSDIDDQHALRYYETVVGFFRCCQGQSNGPDDPAEAVRAALAEALVYYYPVAGRLREDAGGRLEVDCTAEGVVFVEADADVRLEDFGEPLVPPYPCVEELLCDAGDTRAVIGRPLLFMQVFFFFIYTSLFLPSSYFFLQLKILLVGHLKKFIFCNNNHFLSWSTLGVEALMLTFQTPLVYFRG